MVNRRRPRKMCNVRFISWVVFSRFSSTTKQFFLECLGRSPSVLVCAFSLSVSLDCDTEVASVGT